jgi:hypothetical protein
MDYLTSTKNSTAAIRLCPAASVDAPISVVKRRQKCVQFFAQNHRYWCLLSIMKESKQVVTGLIVIVLLLLGYSVFITKRLNRVEVACQELQKKHRILADAFSHIEASPGLIRALMTAMAKSPMQPTTAGRDLRLAGSERNSRPEGVTPK